MPTLAPVVESDFDDMVALRIDALRESLERLGRYDPSRARARLADGFAPQHMHHIEVDDQRIGFVTLRPDDTAQPPSLRLNHLYIRPGAQRRGTGEWVLKWAKRQAVVAGDGRAGLDALLVPAEGHDEVSVAMALSRANHRL